MTNTNWLIHEVYLILLWQSASLVTTRLNQIRRVLSQKLFLIGFRATDFTQISHAPHAPGARPKEILKFEF